MGPEYASWLVRRKEEIEEEARDSHVDPGFLMTIVSPDEAVRGPT
jgi:hypothetical protein